MFGELINYNNNNNNIFTLAHEKNYLKEQQYK